MYVLLLNIYYYVHTKTRIKQHLQSLQITIYNVGSAHDRVVLFIFPLEGFPINTLHFSKLILLLVEPRSS